MAASALAIPATTIDSTTAGPACAAAAWPVSTKMPVPMMAPIPRSVRSTGPSTRLSGWARSTGSIGLVANSDIGLQCAKAHGEVLKMIGRNSEIHRFGPFRFVTGDGLWCQGEPVPLPPRALAVLTALINKRGAVVSKQELMDAA